MRHSQSEAMANARPGEGVRMRRIVKYPRGTHPGAVLVSPQWHQWLRHVRADAPTLEEQQREVRRQEQMRVLAARADARWAGAKRVDGSAAAVPAAEPAERLATAAAASGQPAALPTAAAQPAAETEPVHAQTRTQQPSRRPQTPAEDPWRREERAHGALGEAWQPSSWSPPPASKR